MRFRIGLGFFGVALVVLGSGFLVTARGYADLADRMVARGEADVVPAQE